MIKLSILTNAWKPGTGYVLMNSVWGSRLILVFCSILTRWCDVFNHLLATLGLKLYGLFLISHRTEKDKLLSFKQMSIFDLVLYSIMQPIMPHLNFLWKRAFYIKKISYMNLHMNFFLKARRHWTTSHKVNKEFTSCKYLLQACLSLEIQASALSKWVSGK